MSHRKPMHPNLPPHLQGLRGGLMAQEWAQGRNVQTALDLDSTLEVQGLGAAAQKIWFPAEVVQAANPGYPQSNPSGGPTPRAGTFWGLTERTDGSGVEYQVRDADGAILSSGVSRGLTMPDASMAVTPPFLGQGNGGAPAPGQPFFRANNPWMWASIAGGVIIVGGGIYLATR